MRPEFAFFPEKAMFFHIPAPVCLLLVNPLNCLLSRPHSTSTLLPHTFQPGASFLDRQSWYGQPNLQYIFANSSNQGTTRIVPSGKTNEWTREFMTSSWGISNIMRPLLMKGTISVSPYVLLNLHMYCTIYCLYYTRREWATKLMNWKLVVKVLRTRHIDIDMQKLISQQRHYHRWK